jgi:L-threonylcarbamoyladenylate synthase
VAIPTESSYGLAVDPRSTAGVEAIYRVKRREAGKPLPVVAASRQQVERLGGSFEDPRLMRLSERWPGPLSLLVPVSGFPPASAGTGTLAVRVPGHERLVELLSRLGVWLTATSANYSGDPALTDPSEVADLLEEVPGSMLIDDGILPGGKPSTLVGVGESGVEILRPGRIGSEELRDLLAMDPAESFSAASVEILADGSR